MVGVSRVLGANAALHSDHQLPSSSSSSSPGLISLPFPRKGGEKRVISTRKISRKRAVVFSETTEVLTEKQSATLPLCGAALEAVRTAVGLCGVIGRLDFTKEGCALQAELLIERVIIGCQSFTLIAVAGSLIGSILCFLEGCFFTLESFLQYFHPYPQSGGFIQLLIEAIDMFLVGSALLTFGLSLYKMFMGSNEMKKLKGWPATKSKFFGHFNLERLQGGMGMQSISQAKSKIGHAVVLILQAGLLEKFKNVPLVSGLDLACFAGALFVSSACVFLLSKLTMHGSKNIVLDAHLNLGT